MIASDSPVAAIFNSQRVREQAVARFHPEMPRKLSSVELKFRAFSEPIRLRILHLLLAGELCVCDLVEIIQVPQPTTSRHLSYLRKAGLVSTAKRGLWTYYSLVPAKSDFDRSLLDCLAGCLPEVAQLRADKTRLAQLRRRGGCC